MAYAITIDGAPKEFQAGTWTIVEQANGRSVLTAELDSVDGSYRADPHDELIIDEGGTDIFGGPLTEPIEVARDKAIGGPGHTLKLTAVGFEALAERRNVIDGGFPAGFTLKQALQSLVGYLTDYGVTLHGSQVDGPTLPELVYEVKRLDAIFNELSQITGYIWEISPAKVLRMYAPGTDAAPFNIAEGDGNTIGDIEVSQSIEDYANRIIVRFTTAAVKAYAFLNATANFSNGETVTLGSKTYTFETVLTNVDGHVAIGGSTAVSLNNLVAAINLEAGAGTAYAAATTANSSVEAAMHESGMMRARALEAGASGNSIACTETAANATWITEGGGTVTALNLGADAALTSRVQADEVAEQVAPVYIWERVVDAPETFSEEVAQAIADGLLAQAIVMPKTVVYTTRQTGVRPGQTQTIASTVRGISGSFLITSVTTTNRGAFVVERRVTAVEGAVLTRSWRDDVRESAGGGGGSSFSGGVISGTVENAVLTTGSYADPTWLTSLAATKLTGTIAAARLPQFTGGDVITTGAGSVALAIQNGVIVNAQVHASAAIAWTKISKTGSSLADLDTRSAGDLSSGNLAYARMPSGSGTWSATPTISGTSTFNADIAAGTGYTSNIGALTKKFLTLHCAELWVETLVAQNTIATIGGRVLVGPTNILTVDAGTGATSMTFKYNNFANGDRIYFEANGAVEWIAITSSASGSAGAYVYSVSRNLDGSGANAWTAGDAAFNTGTTGSGFIDLYSVSGVLSGSGPTIVGNVRTGTTYSNIAPRWAIGNLNGLYSYASNVYGAAFGDPSAENLTIDATNGLRIRQGATVYALLASSTFRIGASGGNRVEWNGTNLTVVQSNLTISSAGITMTTPTAYAAGNGYVFSASADIAGAEFGVLAQEPTENDRYLILRNRTTTSDKDTFVMLTALNGVYEASIQVGANNTSNVGGASARTAIAMSADEYVFGVGTGGSTSYSFVGNATINKGATGAVSLTVRNTSSGAGNYAVIDVGNNSDASVGRLFAFSSTYTTSGPEIADGVLLRATRAGGLTCAATHASGEILFFTGGTALRTKIDANGDYIPATDNTMHVGVPAKRFAYMTALAFNTSDMVMENGWALTESYRIGIAEPGVALVDERGDLVAFFGRDRFYAKTPGNVDTLKYHVTTLAERLEMDPTPQIRIKGTDGQGRPLFKTAADVRPMPDPLLGRSNTERGLRG